MLLLSLLITLFLQFHGLNGQSVDENGISLYDKLEQMERHLLEFQGLETSVTPCKFFQTGDPNSGEQTSAEWIRIMFHDAITHNKADGTGSACLVLHLTVLLTNIGALMLQLALTLRKLGLRMLVKTLWMTQLILQVGLSKTD
jgi:hypothetical protein